MLAGDDFRQPVNMLSDRCRDRPQVAGALNGRQFRPSALRLARGRHCGAHHVRGAFGDRADQRLGFRIEHFNLATAAVLDTAAGVTRKTLVARIFTDMRAFRIYDGPSEVHRWSLAKHLLKNDPTKETQHEPH